MRTTQVKELPFGSCTCVAHNNWCAHRVVGGYLVPYFLSLHGQGTTYEEIASKFEYIKVIQNVPTLVRHAFRGATIRQAQYKSLRFKNPVKPKRSSQTAYVAPPEPDVNSQNALGDFDTWLERLHHGGDENALDMLGEVHTLIGETTLGVDVDDAKMRALMYLAELLEWKCGAGQRRVPQTASAVPASARHHPTPILQRVKRCQSRWAKKQRARIKVLLTQTQIEEWHVIRRQAPPPPTGSPRRNRRPLPTHTETR